MAKTAAEVYEERGRKEGRIEGRREGEIEGRRDMLLNLMRQKFGTLPDAVVAKVGAIQEVSELDRLSARVLTATTLEEMGLSEN